ncbi:MAG: rsbP 2, partial [Phycisphaerales bacterium]|nr:rsbP 2 [Phycisphaerales bacterium]
PGMNGFDVLKQLRETYPATRLPVIIATARHDREDIVKALGLGANDYVTKPLDFPVVLARVETQLAHKRAVDRILALESDVRRHNAQLEKANARMRHSLDSAAQVQRSLLPAKTPLHVGSATHGAHFAWRFDPCDELGGDIFNAFVLPNGHIGLYLLDVSGHGVPAALLSVTLSRVLQPVSGSASLVEHGHDAGQPAHRPPADVVGELNRRFPIDYRSGQYFTIFYGVFDCEHRRLTYVSAGHPPAVRVTRSGEVTPLKAEDFAVGWVPDAAFDTHTIDLAPGDRVFVYSDGVTETMDAAARHFGTDRLAEALSGGTRNDLQTHLDGLMAAVTAFRSGEEVLDDVTVLALECACEREA